MDNINSTNVKHRSSLEQIPIYLKKFLRGFVYQNDWVALPLSAVIAGMIAMVIRHSFAVTMSGTLKGAFALSCVAIWNGCFNSIQVVCRERSIIKREHRSGMHITTYLLAHMIFQAMLCALQTLLTINILFAAGVKLSGDGIITSWMFLDIALTFFAVTYAADMLALMLSCIVRTTTAAMTVMPFLLIFQLVFSGGIFSNLPSWAGNISNFTLSKPGLNCIAAQAHYNELSMPIGWHLVESVKNEVIVTNQTLSELLDNADLADYKIMFTPEELNEPVVEPITVDDLINMIGRDQLKDLVDERVSASSMKKDFESTSDNVLRGWLRLLISAIIYALVAMLSLSLIDKDKR